MPAAAPSPAHWCEVVVPHTWQIDPANSNYRGVAWYQRTFNAFPEWSNAAVRLQFESVFHTATVWVNGQLAGEHARKGYTAFTFDITAMLRWDQPNLIAVRVDNAFNDHMLPRGRSSDWAHDGGIFRPVHLLITPKAFVEHVDVQAVPNLDNPDAILNISANCRYTSTQPWSGAADYRIFDDATGLLVHAGTTAAKLTVDPNGSHGFTARETLANAKLWHFDAPHLYRLEFEISNSHEHHQIDTTFGIRSFDIKGGKFQLNGEPVRLMGVERMAGSHPDFGMLNPLTGSSMITTISRT